MDAVGSAASAAATVISRSSQISKSVEVTQSSAVKAPCELYTWLAVWPVATSPSPNFQLKESGSPSGSEDPVAENWTVSPTFTVPEGETFMVTVGGESLESVSRHPAIAVNNNRLAVSSTVARRMKGRARLSIINHSLKWKSSASE